MAKKQTRKQVIFEEAAKLFRDKGYLATSVRELADKVGLEPSSLYSHIKSKEEILQKICFDNAQKFIEGINEIEKLNSTPSEKLKALIALHVTIATEDSTSVTVFNDEWRHLSEDALNEFLVLRRDYENRFKTIIKKGIELGEFKNINPSVALYTILTSVRWLHYWYKPDRELTPADIEKDICTLLIKGLKE